MEIDHSEHIAQQDRLNAAGRSMERYQGTRNSNPINIDQKEDAVHAEIERVAQLPSNSSYATHRMRVLNKIRNLLSVQRSPVQDEELELLFASLSL